MESWHVVCIAVSTILSVASAGCAAYAALKKSGKVEGEVESRIQGLEVGLTEFKGDIKRDIEKLFDRLDQAIQAGLDSKTSHVCHQERLLGTMQASLESHGKSLDRVQLELQSALQQIAVIRSKLNATSVDQ